MTCIVGIESEKGVFIGGDSAGVSGLHVVKVTQPKVFKNGDFIFGFTSSFRMGQLLQYKFNAPYHKPEIDDLEYLATDVVDHIRNLFRDGGFARNKSGEEVGGTFLLGYKGKLYYIDSDYQVGRTQCRYNAVGCGEEYAFGSLYTTDGSNLTEEERIELALKSASEFSGGVCEPFNIVSLLNT